MGILGRLSSLIKSNVNDVIDSMQDPAKEIDQMVRDMEESSRQARTEVAQCLAAEKRLQKRVIDLEGEAADWVKRAETAIRAGDDGLAKETCAGPDTWLQPRTRDPSGRPSSVIVPSSDAIPPAAIA